MKTNTAQTQAPTERQVKAALAALRPDPAQIYTRLLTGNHRTWDVAQQLMTAYPSLDPRRVARAIPLVDSNLIIAPTLNSDPNIYQCPSSNPQTPKYYRVDTSNNTCTCPDSAEQGNVCKHRIAIQIFRILHDELPIDPDPDAPPEDRPWTDPDFFGIVSHGDGDNIPIHYCHWQTDVYAYYQLFFLDPSEAVQWIDDRIGKTPGTPAPWNYCKGKLLGKIKTWELD